MERSTFIKILLGALAAVSFLGSFVLTFLANLIPLRPYGEPELRYIVDDDCACFIFVSCFFKYIPIGNLFDKFEIRENWHFQENGD